MVAVLRCVVEPLYRIAARTALPLMAVVAIEVASRGLVIIDENVQIRACWLVSSFRGAMVRVQLALKVRVRVL